VPTKQEWPSPCPVCGTGDDHAAWKRGFFAAGGFGDLCPHPAELGHGTGCECLIPLYRFDLGLAVPGPPIMGTGPRHDRTGTDYATAGIGDPHDCGWYAKLDAMTWTGCNGQRCARDCGPGHSVRLWVACAFAVGGGHSFHLRDEEIMAVRDVLGKVVP
jgi:hypothetical protein